MNRSNDFCWRKNAMNAENGTKGKRSRRGNSLLPVVALIMAVAALICTASLLFQSSGKNYITAILARATGVKSSGASSVPAQSSSTRSGEATSSGDSSVSETSSASGTMEINDASLDNESFFAHSVFIGDSITMGISSYKLLDNAEVIADNGMSCYSALKNKISVDGNSVLPVTAAKQDDPSKIFILLGANDVTFMSESTFTLYYGKLLDTLRQSCPNAKIYAQSIFPVTSSYEQKNSSVSNKKIDTFNQNLKQLCSKKSVPYVDIASALKSSDGSLSGKYANGGINITLGGYYVWLNYLSASGK